MQIETPEQILELLHSISALKLDQGELSVQFDGNIDEDHGPMSYKYGSFTRQLLELIEARLNGEKVFIATEDDDKNLDDYRFVSQGYLKS